MGIIQNAINQTLQIAGIAARLAPKAMKKVAQKQESQLNQQKNFKSYIGNLETNLGSKVGELPSHVQNLIMQQLKEDNNTDGK